MFPEARAERTSGSGTSRPRLTRSSKGLFASIGGPCGTGISLMTSLSVERPVDDIHLLLARQTHEVDSVPRNADGQVRVVLRMVHRVEKRVAIQDVHIHVKPGRAEESIQHGGQICNAIGRNTAETLWNQGGGEGYTILRVTVRYLRNGSPRRMQSMRVAALHRIGPGCEGLAAPAAIRRVAGGFAIYDVGGNRQNGLGVEGVAISRVLP